MKHFDENRIVKVIERQIQNTALRKSAEEANKAVEILSKPLTWKQREKLTKYFGSGYYYGDEQPNGSASQKTINEVYRLRIRGVLIFCDEKNKIYHVARTEEEREKCERWEHRRAINKGGRLYVAMVLKPTKKGKRLELE